MLEGNYTFFILPRNSENLVILFPPYLFLALYPVFPWSDYTHIDALTDDSNKQATRL